MRIAVPQRSHFGRVIDFLLDNLLLLPFLFVTYLVLEAIEERAGGALERNLERARSIGPLVGALAGAVPQCGFSAAAASFYSGGVITVGTLLAVFLSTSDELVPVLLSAKGVSTALVVRIVAIKAVCAVAVGFVVNALIVLFRGRNVPVPKIDELCQHSHCSCKERHGVVVPALIHTVEIFVFILFVSGALELVDHFWGDAWIRALAMNRPVAGELIGAAVGLVPNCAVSVACAQMYAGGAMSAGALMASSFAGSGLGLLVLFRTNRNFKLNCLILAVVYGLGAVLGWLTGFLL